MDGFLFVQLYPYEDVFKVLGELVKENKKIWIDLDKTNYAILQAAGGSEKQVVTKASPITLLKALKVGRYAQPRVPAIDNLCCHDPFCSII